MRLSTANKQLKESGVALEIKKEFRHGRGGRWSQNSGYIICSTEEESGVFACHWCSTISDALESAKNAKSFVNKAGLKIWSFSSEEVA